MTRGEIYRTKEKVAERGDKPGYYLVVSRPFVAANDDISTVICAPIYGEILGLATEVVLDPSHGVRKASAARCDFLMLMFKHKLTDFVGTLSREKGKALDHALAIALALPESAR